MKILADACGELNQTLIQAIERCQATHHILEEFGATMTAAPSAMVRERLRRMTRRIQDWTASLYSRHSGKGSVYVKMTQTEATVQWEEKFSAWDTKWYEARGATVLSPEKVVAMTEVLMNQLDTGHLAKAVYWINYWENCLVYDTTECLGYLL